VTDRVERLAYLLRRSAGERRQPEALAELSHYLGRAVTAAELLPFEHADALWERAVSEARACWQSAPPRFSRWSPERMARLGAALGSFLPRVAPSVIYLPDPALGLRPLRVSSLEIAPHIRSVSETAYEVCTVVNEDASCGLRLDYQANEHEHGAAEPYELAIWGTDWLDTSRKVLPFELASPAA
jgi:hypothetical protein